MKKKDVKKQKWIEVSTTFLASKHNASLSEIAAHIGIGRATLQRYFPKREDLLREIAADAILKTNAASTHLHSQNLSIQEHLLQLFEVLIPLGDRYHFLSSYPDLMQFEEIREGYEQQIHNLHAFVHRLKEAKMVSLDVPNAWVVYTIDLLIWGAWTAVHEGAIARNDAARLAYRTLLQGVQ